MSFTREQVRHIAALAELEVDDAAAAELERQLTRILEYVRQVESLDAGDARSEDDRAVRLCADAAPPDALRRPPGDFAAAMEQDLFVVPRLGELGGGPAEP